MAGVAFEGWRLSDEERERLLEVFPPAYPDVVADHVTYEGPGPDDEVAAARGARVVGVADDGAGVQALVVEILGSTRRPDGSTWHMTWSLDAAAGRTAVESNDAIAAHGWRPVDPVPFTLKPAFPEAEARAADPGGR